MRYPSSIRAPARAHITLLGNADKSPFEINALKSKDQRMAQQFLSIDSTPRDLRAERLAKKAAEGGDKEPFPVRRALLLGLLAQPVFFTMGSSLRAKPQVDSKTAAMLASALDGDAVTRPAIEEQLEDVVMGRIPSEGMKTISNLVSVLESQGGPSLMAASRRGKWAVPWVGGWQRLTTSETDSSFLGGPIKTSVKGLELVSCRHFIYGPGEGGFINEYLYAPSGQTAESAPLTSKLLLTRSGTLDNLGDNEFEIDFLEPLQAFQLDTDERGVDYLRLAAKDSGAGDIASKPRLQTTYLSGTMWIVRKGDKFAVFQRTDTRSVNDRRGLVADGQLKPADDETIGMVGCYLERSRPITLDGTTR